ncbi:hypothetical protein V9K67_17570 [Paraflavisolibacter sp. H34]|uniref:hypothetical protein n=1 Tax=Huijunlia imazamoxiresistens TaxID=3127457 RepID=UPI003018DB7D
MPKLTNALLALCSCAVFVSCQKETEEGPAPAPFFGKYKVISITGTSVATVWMKEGGVTDSTVTRTNFTSAQHTGTMTLDATKVTSDKLGYLYNCDMEGKSYMNGQLFNTMEFELPIDVPTSSGSVPYKVVGNDSVYFDKGSMIMLDTELETAPVGAKLKLEGNRLSMTMKSNMATSELEQGVRVNYKTEATATITLEKL